MKSIFNKANAPYLVSGALATIALLASGVFTLAPYIGFLAPVAALSLGLPLIVVGAVFSVVAIALSCAAISKNNTIAEKEDQLSQQKNQISSLKEQLSNKEAEVKAHKQKISEKNDQTVVKNVALSNQVGIAEKNLTIQEKSRTLSPKKRVTFNEQANQVNNIKPDQEEFIGSRVNRIVKDGSRDACNAILSANSTKEIFSDTCYMSVKYAKDALNIVGTSLKSVCNVIAHTTANLKFPSMIHR